MSSGKNIRVLIAKPGLDGHDKGAKIVAKALTDAGMEVIYTGIRQQTDAIVNAAIEEDVDVIGLSILSGSHLPICRDLIQRLKESGAGDKRVILGGIIPKKDVPLLKQIGVAEVFRPSTSTQAIVDFIKVAVPKGESGN